jgi:hypothetical protein
MKDNYAVIGIRVIGWKELSDEEFEDLSGFISENIGVYTLEDKVRPITNEEFKALTSQYPDIGEPGDFTVIEVHVVTWKDDAAQEANELEEFSRESIGILALDAEIVPLTDGEWEACLACEPERFS